MKYKMIACTLYICLLLASCNQVAETTWQEQYDLGMRYLSECNYEDAIIAFTAAIEIDPKQAPAYVGRGDAYIGLGETEENLTAALADYETAIGLDDTNAQAYLGLADVYIRMGEYDKALEILQLGLEKTGENQAVIDKIAEIESGKFSDSEGRTRRQNYYSPNGDLKSYYVAVYYNNGTGEQIWYLADGTIDYRNIFDTDADGNRQETTLDANGMILRRYVYMLNEAGIEIGFTSYGSDGEISGRREYTFDSDGNRDGFIDYGVDGTIEQHQETTIDENGNRIILFYDAFGNLREYSVPILDEDGNEVGWTQYAADGTILGTSTYN